MSTFNGTAAVDTFTGSDANDIIYGNGGSDTLNGGGGDDQITGGAGADQISGGDGNDVFYLNAQSDIAAGEHYSGGTGYDRVWLTKGGLNLTGITFDPDVEWLYADSNATVALGAAQLDGFSRVETGTITINKAGVADLTDAAVYTQSFNLAVGGVTLNLTGVTTGNHIVTGSTGVDTVIGSENTDFLFGLAGNDVLNGGGGDDQITGGAGADQISGGAGNDSFFIGAQGDIAAGEHYSGGTGFDQVTLNANNLNLTGIAFDTDVESLYAGNDYGVWLGAAQLDGFSRVETGTITIGKAGVADLTGAAVYTSTFNLAASGITLNLTGASQTSYTVNGSTAADIVTGGENADYLFGNAGNDTLYGGAGDDGITGGAGSDTLYGGGGNDTFYINGQGDIDLSAPPGKFPVPDLYYGGTGDDTVVITTGGIDLNSFGFDPDVERLIVQNNGELYTAPDKLSGFSYVDTGTIHLTHGGYVGAIADLSNSVVYTTTFLVDTIQGVGVDLTGCSQTSYTIEGGSGYDDFRGGTHGDAINGGAGDDEIEGNGGADHLDGDTGTMDLVSYEHSFAAVIVNLANNTTSGGDAEGDTIANFEGVIGSAFDDALIGSDDNNQLDGNGGDDALTGGKGDDQLHGGDGSDTLSGGDGDDQLDGNGGDDAMVGGQGNDTYVVANFGDIVFENAGEGTDEVRSLLPTYTLGDNVENLVLLAGGITGIGNALDNVITGSYGNDTLDGAGGADTVSGGQGDDTFIVDSLDTVIEATGEGTDTIRTALVSYTLGANLENLVYTGPDGFAGTGNELANVIIGGGSDDTLIGGAGNDTLDGSEGNDSLNGGADNDTITGGEGDDLLAGGKGNDVLQGGAGIDTATYAGATGAVVANLAGLSATGADGTDTLLNIENLTGSAFNDTLTGDVGANLIDGGAGADKMSGGFGDDFFVVDNAGDKVYENAGEGTDTVLTAMSAYSLAAVANVENLTYTGLANIGFAGTGNALANVIDASGTAGSSTLSGLAGDDTLLGGGGNDTFDGGLGDDLIYGGDGFDTVTYAKATAAVSVDLEAHTATGQGSDTLFYIEAVTGSAYNDTLVGDGFDNTLSGGSGSDILVGDLGHNVLDGGAGTDTASYAAALDGVRVDLTRADAQNTCLDGYDTLVSIENVTGSAHDDRLFGNALANTLIGGVGDDVLWGGLGNDVLSGGAGFDIALYVDATSGVTVSLAKTTAQNTGGAGTDTLTGIEALTGSDYADTLTGSAGDDTLDGGAGDDLLVDGAGYDVLIGGAGNDTVSYAPATAGVTVSLAMDVQDTVGAGVDVLSGIENLTGSAFNDTFTGDAGENRLLGGNGSDVLDGGSGDDWLQGGAGADVLTGGLGADRFVFAAATDSSGTAVDRITDFAAGDILDLSAIDANTTLAGNQAFTQADAFHHIAGELVLTYNAATQTTTLSADAKADFTLLFNGDITMLTAGWLL